MFPLESDSDIRSLILIIRITDAATIPTDITDRRFTLGRHSIGTVDIEFITRDGTIGITGTGAKSKPRLRFFTAGGE